jgi:metal-responsive CopG/Arc/MetJ family transcriptional regulator
MKGGEIMRSQLTVRLPDDLDKAVAEHAKQLRLKRSDIVRMALERFFKESVVQEEGVAYRRVSGLIGSVSSGVPDLGSAHREHLVKRLKKRA